MFKLRWMDPLLVKLRRIELFRVRIPFHEPFRISSGSVSEKESIVIRVQSRKFEGFGEASPMGGTFYSPETPDTTWQALVEDIVPRLLKLRNVRLQDLDRILAQTPGEPFAKAGLEGACWDLVANRDQMPLYELLGGSKRPLPSGVALGIYPSIETLLERVEQFVAQGYQRVKIKIEPGWDVEPVRAIRRAFDRLPLMVDANAAYSLSQAQVFEELDQCNLMMIEQPLAKDALAEHAELQRRIRTPICLDESAESIAALEEIIRLGSARILNIKVQRAGGLMTARKMHDRCRQARLPCWLGTMPELGIASAQGLHLATLDNFTYPTDVEASSRWFVDDLVDPPIKVDPHGLIHIPDGPGMGYKVSREKIARYCSWKQAIDA